MAKTKKRPLGDIVDTMYDTRERIRALNAQIEELKPKLKDLEAEFVDRCKEEETDIARGTKATASYKVEVLPTVVDWTKVLQYISRRKAFHLFERRISTAAWREEVANRARQKPIPGIDSFERERVNLRTL